jgi:hypothetical protein
MLLRKMTVWIASPQRDNKESKSTMHLMMWMIGLILSLGVHHQVRDDRMGQGHALHPFAVSFW